MNKVIRMIKAKAVNKTSDITVCLCYLLAKVLCIALGIKDNITILTSSDIFYINASELRFLIEGRAIGKWTLGQCIYQNEDYSDRVLYIYEFQSAALLKVGGINIFTYIRQLFTTVAHEMRHAWQLEHRPDIFSFEEAYNDQPHEEDARKFADKVISIIKAIMWIAVGIIIGGVLWQVL